MDEPATLPTGTITFLFTDIEGSTRLWEQHPDAMRLALARHDALLRAAVETNGGHVFKTMGDQFCAAFATAPDAVVAALVAQQALLGIQVSGYSGVQEGPASVPEHLNTRTPEYLKVRMALHTGAVEERAGDYFGPPLNRVARLLDAGHGGQILLSQAAADLVLDTLPAAASLSALGTHRLKDLQQPERIFQLVHPDLPGAFPPLRSLEAFDHNLPRQLTSLVGREKEIAKVRQLLTTTALLTLTGSGGCGKTRLALQVATELLEEYPGGVWLVELAALADPALVPQAVASALGVREVPGRPLIATLTDYLRPKQMLLVLDNCEHLLSSCAHLADTLLRSCPELRILASSREGLAIAGERTYRVPSLSLPDPQQLPTMDRLHEFEAVRLFTDRATVSQPAFTLTEQNAPAVLQVCQRLDGIPLAIELAAARVKALPVEKLNERLDDMFRLLTGGSRTALPRQQTLRALIDWSYDLLSPLERTLLRRLSVFAGGWTLEAAEQICSAEGYGVQGRGYRETDTTSDTLYPAPCILYPDDVLDLLSSLVGKSLVTYDEQGGKERYRLLEAVRQYARDRLLESGEVEAVRGRHRDFFMALAEQAEPELMSGNQETWFTLLDAEHGNMRAALAWALEVEPASALRLAGALWRFWEVRAYCAEGRAALECALERSGDTSAELRARGLVWAGKVTFQQGDSKAAELFLVEGLALNRARGDQRFVAWSLSMLGQMARRRRDFQDSGRLFAESLAIQRQIGDRWGISTNVLLLGLVAWEDGNLRDARQFLAEGLQLKREIGDQRGIAVALSGLGNVARAVGDYPSACRYYQEGLAIRRRLGDNLTAQSLNSLGWTALEQGEVAEARIFFEEARAFPREAESGRAAIETLVGLGYLALAEGNLAAARASFNEGVERSHALGANRWIARALQGLGSVARVEGQRKRARALLKESLALRLERGNTLEVPVGLEALAPVVGPERAARLLGAAEAMREAAGTPRPPADRAECDPTTAAVREALGNEAFAAAWAEGRAMTLEAAIAYALEEAAGETTGGS